MLSNRLVCSRVWSTLGDYPVVLRAYNESYPNGVTATTVVHVVSPPVHYVNQDSAFPEYPIPPGKPPPATSRMLWTPRVSSGRRSWSPTVCIRPGDGLVSLLTNRVAVDKPLVVQSVNGPDVTIIAGQQAPATNGPGAVRCVWLCSEAILSGFTLTNGATRAVGEGNALVDRSGGGAWCESKAATLTNCVLAGNASAYAGGGALRGHLSTALLRETLQKVYHTGREENISRLRQRFCYIPKYERLQRRWS